jgi:hypothetical protein
MIMFPFLKRNNEIRNARFKFPPIIPLNAGKYRHVCPQLHSAVFCFANCAVSQCFFREFQLYRASSGVFMILYANKQPPPRELLLRNPDPRPADGAGEGGLGASVFRFSGQETPGIIR